MRLYVIQLVEDTPVYWRARVFRDRTEEEFDPAGGPVWVLDAINSKSMFSDNYQNYSTFGEAMDAALSFVPEWDKGTY